MAKEYSRTQRIGDQMQRELAQLIRREVKDPRVGLVTITAVEVSRDVGHAKIFITVMGQDSAEEIAQSIKVLELRRRFPAHAAGSRDEAAQRSTVALPLRRKRRAWCASVGIDRARSG